jgi:hypothetical protein
MYAPAAWVGKSIRCPDCYTENLVRAPAQRPVHRAAAEWTDQDEQQYRLREDSSQPQPSGEKLHPVVCDVCSTRMYAAPDMVGKKIVCPDCGAATLVRAARSPGPKRPTSTAWDPLDSIEDPADRRPDDFQLAPDAAPVLFQSHAQDLLQEAEQKIRELQEAEPPRVQEPEQLGARPVFTYPFRGSMILLWAGMAGGIWLVILLLFLAFSGGDLRVMLVSLLMLAVGAGSLLGFTATHLVSIIYNTSEGYDAIVHWPENHVIEWILDAMYFATSAAFSVLPWVLLDKLQVQPIVRDSAGGVLFFLLYPILLLSLLESGSRVFPFSELVLGTLRTNWGQWVRFYARTLMLVALCAAVGALDLVVRGGIAGRLAIAAVLAAALAASLIIYCRALGVLVLACQMPAPRDEGGRESQADAAEADLDHAQGLAGS